MFRSKMLSFLEEVRVKGSVLTAVVSSISKKILLRTKLFSSFLVLAKVHIDLALANLLFWDGLGWYVPS